MEAELLAYMAKQDARRSDEAAARYNSFTERERALIHNAAVMGYVQGMRHPVGEHILKDRAIVALVVDACLAFPDLYRAISGYVPDTEEGS